MILCKSPFFAQFVKFGLFSFFFWQQSWFFSYKFSKIFRKPVFCWISYSQNLRLNWIQTFWRTLILTWPSKLLKMNLLLNQISNSYNLAPVFPTTFFFQKETMNFVYRSWRVLLDISDSLFLFSFLRIKC